MAGGDKVPRKGGPGTTQSDLLVINKVDLAEAVGADMGVMMSDAQRMRDGGPTIPAIIRPRDMSKQRGVEEIVDLIKSAWMTTEGYALSQRRWASGGPQGSGRVPD